jgi:hypothetical protein
MEKLDMGTNHRSQLMPVVLKPEYIKLSPSSPYYRKVMSLAALRGCAWQDVVRDALTFYFEFQEKKTTILTLG